MAKKKGIKISTLEINPETLSVLEEFIVPKEIIGGLNSNAGLIYKQGLKRNILCIIETLGLDPNNIKSLKLIRQTRDYYHIEIIENNEENTTHIYKLSIEDKTIYENNNPITITKEYIFRYNQGTQYLECVEKNVYTYLSASKNLYEKRKDKFEIGIEDPNYKVSIKIYGETNNESDTANDQVKNLINSYLESLETYDLFEIAKHVSQFSIFTKNKRIEFALINKKTKKQDKLSLNDGQVVALALHKNGKVIRKENGTYIASSDNETVVYNVEDQHLSIDFNFANLAVLDNDFVVVKTKNELKNVIDKVDSLEKVYKKTSK